MKLNKICAILWGITAIMSFMVAGKALATGDFLFWLLAIAYGIFSIVAARYFGKIKKEGGSKVYDTENTDFPSPNEFARGCLILGIRHEKMDKKDSIFRGDRKTEMVWGKQAERDFVNGVSEEIMLAVLIEDVKEMGEEITELGKFIREIKNEKKSEGASRPTR